jgi:hypothetical protein
MTASPTLALLTPAATSPNGATPTQPPITGPAACQVEGHGTSGLIDAILEDSLAQAYAIDSTVVVARVTGVLRPLTTEGPWLSVYSAEVTDAVTGELRTGDTFAVWQNGGLSDGQVHRATGRPDDPRRVHVPVHAGAPVRIRRHRSTGAMGPNVGISDVGSL